MDNSKETIATRKQEQWAPKVGEKCFWKENQVIPKLLEPDCDGDIIVTIQGEYITVKPEDLKQQLKHTKQELLAYELYRLLAIDEDSVHSIDDAKKLPFFKRHLKIVESGRFK